MVSLSNHTPRIHTPMKQPTLLLLALLCSACATTAPSPTASTQTTHASAPPSTHATDSRVRIPASAEQASLVEGRVPPGSALRYGTRAVRIGADGSFVVAVSRTQTGTLVLDLTLPDGDARKLAIAIVPRSFHVERINGVPKNTVNPPPEIAARIAREEAQVNAVRTRDDDREDYLTAFIWPAHGRISGLFGNQRIYNGSPGAAHSGVDIAAAKGTPVHAPAGGIVTFAQDLYLTGNTVLIDHGHGVSSNFLHLSRVDVTVGERVSQGQVIGLVGMSGRATGPHLHWGMNWFDVRIDPETMVPPPAK